MPIRLETQSATRPQSAEMCVVIPVHNALGYLKRCVTSLRATLPRHGVDVVIVDDASGVATQSYLGEQQNWAKVVRLTNNQGFSAACNTGANESSAPWLFFANSDIEFPPNWAETMLELIRSKPEFGAFGFKLDYPDGTIQHAGIITIEDPQNLIPFGMLGLHVGAASQLPAANQFAELDAVTAAALLVRTDDFERIGGFDEGFFNGGEDIDLCLKLRESQVRIGYSPVPKFVHHESKSGPERWLKTLENQRRVAQRWFGKVKPNARINESFSLEATAFPHIKSTSIESEYAICVLLDNHLSTINESLESIRANAGLFNQIHLIDNGSEDGTSAFLDLLTNCDPRIEIHRIQASDLNAEIHRISLRSNCPFIAVVDGATFVSPSWLVRLRRALEDSGADFALPLCNTRHELQSVANYGSLFSGATLDAREIAIQLALANNRLSRDCAIAPISPILTSIERLPKILDLQTDRGVIAHDVYVHQLTPRAVANDNIRPIRDRCEAAA